MSEWATVPLGSFEPGDGLLVSSDLFDTSTAEPTKTDGSPAKAEGAKGGGTENKEGPQPWGPCLCGKGSDAPHKTVIVEPRTWIGINKPGGTARITKRTNVVEKIFDEDVVISMYDVTYVMGGREKNVRETYISCTVAEGGKSRPSCPRERFTVPVSEPRRPRASPITVPSSSGPSSPLGQSSASNNRASSKPAAGPRRKKEKQPTQKCKPAPPALVSKATVPSRRLTGSDRSQKRDAPGNTHRAKAKKVSKKASKENREVPVQEPDCNKKRHGMMAATDVYWAQAGTGAAPPLEEGRMEAFACSLYGLFNKDGTDKLSLPAVKAGINKFLPVGASPYDDKEIGSALAYLEDEQNKVMLSEDVLYRI